MTCLAFLSQFSILTTNFWFDFPPLPHWAASFSSGTVSGLRWRTAAHDGARRHMTAFVTAYDGSASGGGPMKEKRVFSDHKEVCRLYIQPSGQHRLNVLWITYWLTYLLTDQTNFIGPNHFLGDQKSTHQWFRFSSKLEKPYFGPILTPFCPKMGKSFFFFEKSGSVTFLHLWIPNFMQKIRKISWANSEKKRYWPTTYF